MEALVWNCSLSIRLKLLDSIKKYHLVLKTTFWYIFLLCKIFYQRVGSVASTAKF